MQLLVRLPVRPERAHIITMGEFAIINLGVTLQTYMPVYSFTGQLRCLMRIVSWLVEINITHALILHNCIAFCVVPISRIYAAKDVVKGS